MKKITENDEVFIIRGKDEDEIYLIDDPAIIARLEAKIKKLEGKPETEIQRQLLFIVNPERYPANGKK